MNKPTQKLKIKPILSKKDGVKAGETWTINDALTRGHKSSITKRKGNEFEHIPRTHKPFTRGRKNIKLQENPQKDDNRDCFILPKVQTSKVKDLGKKQNEPITNPIDKSIIRHLKKEHKKR